jgi:hypothetical protein
MNLFSKATLVLFILLSFYDVQGQTDFRPGYIITNGNDTLHGLIDYRGDARNSKRCDFKEEKNSVTKEFLPFSIKGYRYNTGKFYISKSIQFNGKEIQLFLEFLVSGIANLYYYSDGTEFHYFLEKTEGQMLELTNEQKYFIDNGEMKSRKTKRYIGLLRYEFADCPQIFPLINMARLENKSLIEITKKYHENICNDERCIVYEKHLPAIRVKIAPFISMNESSLKFSNNPYYESMRFNKPAYPTMGLLLNIFLPNMSEKLSFQVSGEFGKSKYHSTGTDPYDNAPVEEFFNTSIVKIKTGFKYTFPTGKLRPTFNMGGNIIKFINKDGRRIVQLLGTSTGKTREWNDVPAADNLYGYYAELGVDYHMSASVVTFVSLGYDSYIGRVDF